MKDERERVGEASVQNNEWKGTVACDNADDDRLYELAGLDRDKWSIVGIDLFGGYRDSDVFVYAIERSHIKGAGGWASVAAENDGCIPVTRFRLRSEEGIRNFALEVVSQAFKRWNVIAKLGSAVHDQGFDLVIERYVEPGDEPHQK